ncbi:MAG TPA: uroporphyrinogen-III synthase [Chitinophagaceae bacterium]|nr:uroporphyrinogen-III synthase [Chitinophagaceae bacterium]
MELASAAGIRIRNIEFITTEPLISQTKADSLSALNPTTVVFTSTNSVEALSALLKQYPVGLRATEVYCMAGRTAEAVKTMFPSLTVKGTGNSARELADKIIHDGVKTALFFSGNLRRDDLPDQLMRHGVLVSELEIYRTHPRPVKLDTDFSGVIFFSPSAADSFFSLNQLNDNVVCFAIGETTAGALTKYTSNQIMVANIPRQENVIAMVIDHFRK